MTVDGVARVLCLASGIFGRPAWDDAKCREHAGYVVEAAARHHVRPFLMVAVEVHECDMADRDAPVYVGKGLRRKIVGFDACPMGVRIRGVALRRRLGPRELYDRAATILSRGLGGYNSGNPTYAAQVLSLELALEGRRPPRKYARVLTPRTVDTLRRLRKVFPPAEEPETEDRRRTR